jgi:zinc protease
MLAALAGVPAFSHLAEAPNAATLAAPLPQDDRNVYGKLDNGVRYIIRQHSNPPGRVVVYLHVATGSLNETDAQDGLAHYLEHMAFNGTTNFGPEKLVPYLNSLGMTFGQHTNAHTTYHETVYKLTMPDNKPETVDNALRVMSDYASGMLLLDDEIEEERGVILEERRSGQNLGRRMREATMKQVFDGTLLAKRTVIGEEASIKTVQRDQFLDYYNTWYRPDRMTLVVVGEIDPAAVIEKAAKSPLGTFQARGPAREDQKIGFDTNLPTRAFVITDAEQQRGEWDITAIDPGRPEAATVGDMRKETIEGIASWIMSRRFDDLVSAGKASFQDASVSASTFFDQAVLPNITVEGQPGDWEKTLRQAIYEVKRALDHGFTEQELALARTEILAGAKRAVQTEQTVDATNLTARLASQVGQKSAIMSASQRLALIEGILPTITTADLLATMKEHFAGQNWQYIYNSPTKSDKYTPPATEEILAIAKSAWEVTTEAPAKEVAATSILSKQPTPGVIKETSTDAELKITTASFENGVVMHHRFMDYKKDSVLITLTMPGGRLEETADTRGLSSAASIMLSKPATSTLTSTQIRDLMTGKNIGVGGGVGVDALQISVSGSPKDAAAGLELVHAILTDGKLEQTAFDEWKKRTLQQLEQQKKNPQAFLAKGVDQTIRASDPRLIQITEEIVNQLDPVKAEAWMKRITSGAAIEVAVVGEMDADTAKTLIAKYVGSLPNRERDLRALDSLRKIERGPGPFKAEFTVPAVVPQAVALGGFIGTDLANTYDRRALNLAAQIMSDRMIKRIREQERLVYSIGATSQAAREVPGTGLILAAAPTDPANAQKLADTITEMMKEFAVSGPTADELAVARRQVLNNLETAVKEPATWLSILSDFGYRQRSLDELRQMTTWVEGYSAEDVRSVAAKYIIPERQVQIVIIPDLKATGTAPATPAPTSAAPN